MLKPFLRCLIVIYLASAPVAALSQAEKGEMFGLRVGDVLGAYDAAELIVEWFGMPYVERGSTEMAEEFSHLQVLVMPVSGTIMGLRAVAEFDTEGASRAFAERLRRALTAQFGQSILCFVEPGPNFYDHPCHTTDGAAVRYTMFRDIDIYMSAPGHFELRVSHYTGSVTNNHRPEVQLVFGPAEGCPAYPELLESFIQEAEEFDAASRASILEHERHAVLRGTE